MKARSSAWSLRALMSPWFSHALWAVLIVGVVIHVGLTVQAIVAGDWISTAGGVLVWIVWTEPVTRPFRDATLDRIRGVPSEVRGMSPELLRQIGGRMVFGYGLGGKPILLPYPPQIARFSEEIVRELMPSSAPANAAFPPAELTLNFVNGAARYRLWAADDYASSGNVWGELAHWTSAPEDVTVVIPGAKSATPVRGH